jgi:hypothetical protein
MANFFFQSPTYCSNGGHLVPIKDIVFNGGHPFQWRTSCFERGHLILMDVPWPSCSNNEACSSGGQIVPGGDRLVIQDVLQGCGQYSMYDSRSLLHKTAMLTWPGSVQYFRYFAPHFQYPSSISLHSVHLLLVTARVPSL